MSKLTTKKTISYTLLGFVFLLVRVCSPVAHLLCTQCLPSSINYVNFKFKRYASEVVWQNHQQAF